MGRHLCVRALRVPPSALRSTALQRTWVASVAFAAIELGRRAGGLARFGIFLTVDALRLLERELVQERSERAALGRGRADKPGDRDLEVGGQSEPQKGHGPHATPDGFRQ